MNERTDSERTVRSTEQNQNTKNSKRESSGRSFCIETRKISTTACSLDLEALTDKQESVFRALVSERDPSETNDGRDRRWKVSVTEAHHFHSPLTAAHWITSTEGKPYFALTRLSRDFKLHWMRCHSNKLGLSASWLFSCLKTWSLIKWKFWAFVNKYYPKGHSRMKSNKRRSVFKQTEWWKSDFSKSYTSY